MILSAPVPVSIEPPASIPVGFYAHKARELAQLIILGVDTPSELGKYFELTIGQQHSLFTSAYFKQLLAEAQHEFRDTNIVTERAKAMARLASPEAVRTLLELSRSADDSKTSQSAAESLLAIAGISTKVQQIAPGLGQQGISINISFDTGAPPVAPLKTVIEHDG